MVVLLAAGCVAGEPGQTDVRELEELRNAQETWIHGLARGQPIQEISAPVAPNSRYSLEIFQDGDTYQYIKGMHPGTKMLYGLYFVSGRLEALLVDQDVTDFFQCEHAYRHRSGSWLKTGIGPTNEWVARRDRLGQEFDARVTHAPGAGSDASKSVEAVAHLPLAIMVAPFYGAYWLSGGPESDRERARERLEEGTGLQAGSATVDDLERLLGSPGHRADWETGSLWAYDHPRFLFGIAGNVIVWKESGRVETPRNPATRLGPADCGGMEFQR
jgi:hypothetical protein